MIEGVPGRIGGAEVDVGGERTVFHQPHAGIARLVPPQHVGGAVAVENAGAGGGCAAPQYVGCAVDETVGGRGGVPVGSDVAEVGVGGELTVVHQPDAGVAGIVAPQQVGGAVGVEIAGAVDMPVRRDVAEV